MNRSIKCWFKITEPAGVHKKVHICRYFYGLGGAVGETLTKILNNRPGGLLKFLFEEFSPSPELATLFKTLADKLQGV